MQDTFNTLLDNITTEISGARRQAVALNTYVMDRDLLLSWLNQLHDEVPSAITQANTIVNQQEEILSQANNKARLTVEDSQKSAQQTLDNANAQAQHTTEEATAHAQQLEQKTIAECQQRLNDAGAQAQHIIQAAQEKAAYLVSQEQVLQTAKAEADQYRAQATQEMLELQNKVKSYLDSLHVEMDHYVSEMLTTVRASRQNLNNR